MGNDNSATSFDNRCGILSDLWMQYRFESQFEDFISYNDIGLPLAFLVDEELVKPTDKAKAMIDETFELLLAALSVEDNNFESLDDLLME